VFGLVLGLVALLVLGFYLRSRSGPKSIAVKATVLGISPGTRSATLEYVHPNSGQRLQGSGSIPMNCEILIDGRPGQFTDIRPGDAVTITGIMNSDRQFLARRVVLQRTPPATRPADVR
jgi:hypothetical protein